MALVDIVHPALGLRGQIDQTAVDDFRPKGWIRADEQTPDPELGPVTQTDEPDTGDDNEGV